VKNIANSLELTRQKIALAEQRYGRVPGSVKLVAVSKTRPDTAILKAAEHGQLEFGENYIQEAVTKISILNSYNLVWHFIGPVQSNKTHTIAANFDWVHSIDRVKIAKRLNDARPDHLAPINACIQINISNEPNKAGIRPDDLEQLIDECSNLPRLRVRGLMTLPEITNVPEKQRSVFREVKKLLDKINLDGVRYDTLSMGTSHDYEAAIAEGSTIVRIGTAIFGART
jgi:PLP dependent protein